MVPPPPPHWHCYRQLLDYQRTLLQRRCIELQISEQPVHVQLLNNKNKMSARKAGNTNYLHQIDLKPSAPPQHGKLQLQKGNRHRLKYLKVARQQRGIRNIICRSQKAKLIIRAVAEDGDGEFVALT